MLYVCGLLCVAYCMLGCYHCIPYVVFRLVCSMRMLLFVMRSLPLAVCWALRVAYCSTYVACDFIFVVHCIMCLVCCILRNIYAALRYLHGLLCVVCGLCVCYLLFTVDCALCVVCYLLLVGCGLLFIVCCLLCYALCLSCYVCRALFMVDKNTHTPHHNP